MLLFYHAQGIRAVQLLVLQSPALSLKDADGSTEAMLLKRFLGTMDLGWQVAVQPDGETNPSGKS